MNEIRISQWQGYSRFQHQLIPMFALQGRRSEKENVYSEEFQAMLDRLEADDHEESTTNEKGSWRKRRLSMDQIKSLEESFEANSKLEPDRKVKIAEELGLEPRQVAIWFQNRRARCKAKQLVKDYEDLEASYVALKRGFDSLEQERRVLLAQFKDLEAKVEAKRARELRTPDLASVSSDGYYLHQKFQSHVMSLESWNMISGEGSINFF